MKTTAIALFSGGLDSILAVEVIRRQGVDVHGVMIKTPFFGNDSVFATARSIDLPLTVLDITDEYFTMLRNPRYGYGKNMNPCIDCHALMIRKAGDMMTRRGDGFIVTGEVLGQRPKSQNKQSLAIVEKQSGYPGYVLRPLSARLLPETIPEQQGIVDREKFLDIQGRSRRRQLDLAREWGVAEYDTPAGGCRLTEPAYATRLRDLFEHQETVAARDAESLKVGRHLRLDEDTKIVVGRKKSDNETIEQLFTEDDVLITVRDYPGPTTLIPHGGSREGIREAVAVTIFYSDAPAERSVAVVVKNGRSESVVYEQAARRESVMAHLITSH